MVKTWFVCNETWHITLFGICYCVEMVRIKKKVICLKFTFLRYFLSIFGTFPHEVVQTSFVCHETFHTTLFGIDYCVEIVIIENNSHMLEITC